MGQFIFHRHTFETLDRALTRIKDDLLVKLTSLNIDEKCSEVRLQLLEHPGSDKIMIDKEQ